jgi:hypothetical protein
MDRCLDQAAIHRSAVPRYSAGAFVVAQLTERVGSWLDFRPARPAFPTLDHPVERADGECLLDQVTAPCLAHDSEWHRCGLVAID